LPQPSQLTQSFLSIADEKFIGYTEIMNKCDCSRGVDTTNRKPPREKKNKTKKKRRVIKNRYGKFVDKREEKKK
jgi:hypothetical protein